MLKSHTDSCPVWRPSSQHCPWEWQGPGVVPLIHTGLPGPVSRLYLEKFSLYLSGASRGPLNLVSDSAPFPYVRQN